MAKETKETINRNLQAEVSACRNFLLTKGGMTETAIEAFLSADSSGGLLIQTTKNIKEMIDKMGLCSMQKEMKVVERELQNHFSVDPFIFELGEAITSHFEMEGKQSWSCSASQERQDKSKVTFTLKVIDPNYEAPEKVAKRAELVTTESKLKSLLDSKFQAINKLAQFKLGTKDSTTFPVSKAVVSNGLQWRLQVGIDTKVSKEED